MLPLHRIALGFSAVMSLCGLVALAQDPNPRPLIVERVNENQLLTLKGNTPPVAEAKNDAGRVTPDLRMTDLILVLRRSPEQQAAFDAFVESQYDPGSPNFHHWLQANEVGEKFGPALADIATVSKWLESHGLSVDGISEDRMTIRFSGTAAQVESAFHTEIHNLVVKGERHISNMSDPQIPMALEAAVVGPKALHNFVPRPMHRTGAKVTLNQQTGKWERIPGTSPFDLAGFAGAKTIPQPEMATNGSGAVYEDMTPSDFATIYNVAPLWQSSIDGTGQTIAVVGRSDINTADVASFRSLFGLPAKTPNIIHNGTDPGACTGTTGSCTLDDQVENTLDVEWSGAIAKNATIDLVVTQQTNSNDPIYESANYVINHNTASVLSVSYGLCELGMGTANNTAYNNLWHTASSAGIAVFTATGDSGSPACDQGQSSSTPYGANFGLSVSGVASTPYDTAVGGTDFTWCNPTPSGGGCASGSPYWAVSNNSTTGANAQSYLPEVPWNDTCTTPAGINYIKALQGIFGGASVTDAESACNYIANNYLAILNAHAGNPDLSFFVNVEGAGGGASNCTTSDGSHPSSCTGGYATPSWQTGVTGLPGDGKRHVPDVSFFAGAGFFNSAYIVCVSAAGTCLTSTSATSGQTAQEIGGTSVSTPAMAGVMALINQKAGSAQGNPNSVLYHLAAQQTYSSCKSETGTVSNGCYFNDVDAGTIAMPCESGSPNCTVGTSGDAYGVLSGFAAGVGYDSATGLGSLNVANVVNAWPATTGTATATVTVTPASNSIVSNQSLNVTVAVSGSSGTPTGSVTLSSGSYTSAAATLTSGSATITIPANKLAAGTATLTANYGGDATYAMASGTGSVTVTQAVLLTPTVTVSANPTSFSSGQGTIVSVAVSGSGGTPGGTVVLTSGSFTSASHTLAADGTTTFNLSPGLLAVGTDTITAQYSGDSVYAAANGTTQVTVTQATYSLAATAPAAINRGSQATSTVTVSTSNGYSGTIAVTCTLTTSPTGASNLPTCAVTGSPVALSATVSTGNATATVSTTAATASMQKPRVGGWAEGGGAVLALLMFLGVPARRRAWRAMLGMVVLMLAVGSFSACGGGGGGSNGGGGGGGSAGTTSGDYTFTVTATGTPAQNPAPTKTFTVHVN